MGTDLRLAVGLGTGAVLLLMTACGMSSPSGPDPAGRGDTVPYTTVTTGHLTVQYPSSWSTLPQTQEPFTVAVGGDGDELRIAGEFSDDIGASGAMAKLQLPAMRALKDYTPEKSTDITVQGAYDAMIRQFTYTQDGKPWKGVWIVASQWPYPKTAVVAVTGEQLDPDVVQHIADTLVFKAYH